MFKRIILEDWQFVVPYVCFALIGGAFLIIVIQAFRMKKRDVEHLSNLPLQDNKPTETTDQDS